MDAATESSLPAAGAAPYDGIDGVAWAYHFSKTGVAELVQGVTLHESLKKQEVWLWLNFDLDNERASAAIAALPHLPPSDLAMLRSNEDRQQIDRFGQVIGGMVADYEARDPVGEKLAVGRNFVIAPYAFLSAGRRLSHARNRVRVDLQSARRVPDVLTPFHALIDELATAISLVLNELASKSNEKAERSLDQKEIGSDALGQARRRLVRARRQALLLRGIPIHMLSERSYGFDGDAVAERQRIAARIDALVDALDSFQERAHALQDELKARRAEKTNKRLTVLAIVSTLLLPPTFITGGFGMNMIGMPLQQNAYGFWMTCRPMVALVVGMLITPRRIRLI